MSQVSATATMNGRMSGLRRYADATVRVVLYAYAYVFLEWLFQVTKPSFLDAWPAIERVRALLVGALPFVLAALALHGALCLVAAAVSRSGSTGGLGGALLKLTPALVAGAIVMMLVDNFTYTVFGWGIVDTTAATAPIYWAALGLVVVRHLAAEPLQVRFAAVLAVALAAVSVTALLLSLLGAKRYVDPDYRSERGDGKLPNIVLFAADGVSAGRVSGYGYPRQTTPSLDRYFERALVADNAFTNSGWTTSSLTAMMTSKSPATTKVLYPPYTLKGRDAYETLPHILRKLGYRTLQESVRYYADGPDLNWRDSFDEANGRALGPSLPDDTPLTLQASLVLVDQLEHRLTARLLQLLRIEKMQNPHAQVGAGADAKVYGEPDAARMARVYDFIARSPQPFFVQIHLMGTHCCTFESSYRILPRLPPVDPRAPPDAADLDDAIRESDHHFGELMDRLEKRGLLDDTLVVYSSDHDEGWEFRSQVPLLFLFPRGEHRGHRAATTQLLDVAPTILDYLGVRPPDWMEGKSLLGGEPDPYRPVFAIYRMVREHFESEKKDRLARLVDLGPPTYGLRLFGMVVCQRWYILDLRGAEMASGPIASYVGSCPADVLPDRDRAREMMSRHLRERGFSF
ncbi:MAG: sulfatase-like hydrolase/transferase [Thermoanaerobaculia bacterium]